MGEVKVREHLAASQIEDLTDCKRPKEQSRQLRKYGMDHRITPTGRIRLTWREVHRVMGPGIRLTRMYLIRSEGNPKFLKIGISDDPIGRIKALQTASPVPLTLLCDRLGCKETERYMHERFGHLRVQGEWFKDRAEIYRAFKLRKSCAG